MTLNFVTSNTKKFKVAKSICGLRGVELNQLVLDVEEIQGEDPETIITDKARRAFDLAGKPIIVSDDTWSFSALNGFPGAYMKSINHWFTTEDFLNLMKDKDDRNALIIRMLAYYDGDDLVIFRKDSPGKILEEPRGNSDLPVRNIYVSDFDGGLTLAEVDQKGLIDSVDRVKLQPEPWHDLLDWMIEINS